MPKEIINPDVKLSREFQRLINEQERKITLEMSTRKTLWAFEALIQDKEVTRETPFREVFKKIRQRSNELKRTISYGKYVKGGKSADETGTEFNAMAGEEIEKAEKLLGFFEEADRVLTFMNTPDFDQTTELGYIQDKFKKDIEKMEAEVDSAEIKSRGGNGQ